LVHQYRHGFSGFAARLSAEEASSIAQKPGVVSVFPDFKYQLHTTRSWDFLKYETDSEIYSNPISDSQGSDTVIGILDSGIWPESPSFIDKDIGPIPSRWKGTCMEGINFSKSNCNRKLIGARFYKDTGSGTTKYDSPRDMVGHSTHVASTATGSVVEGASYYGLAAGTAKGGSPGSRIAVYTICYPGGCQASRIFTAFDDVIADGVDVLSLSLGVSSWLKPPFLSDPIAIGAFHAVKNGIIVVCTAGNSGPDTHTVVNTAPWILTVAATTIDRIFESDVALGGNKLIKGGGINFANIEKSPVYPLIYAQSANKSDDNGVEARNCNPYSMDGDMIKGKIVLCDNDDPNYSKLEKMQAVKALGIGLVLIDDESRIVPSNYGAYPMTAISSKDGAEILHYINSTKNPVATILATISVTKQKPAPIIPNFSSRGPSTDTRNILMPDIAAPGVAILAAWMGNETNRAIEGKPPSLFDVLSGTSMACPHVSGIAATVKSRIPTWCPSAIKSAIMTTASQTNNLRTPITTVSGSNATAYDYDAGEVSTTRPFQPGLVYETTTVDYLNFLCYYGFNKTTIKIISKNVPDGFGCPKKTGVESISNINYPSITISSFNETEGRKISRIITNVAGDADTVYAASVEAPKELKVEVIPDKLLFTKSTPKLSYQVMFTSTSIPLKGDVFGSIMWFNGKYKVRTPFVVS
ncbi:LOW QUALITY PROTEIN: Peptidase_S8 domain-containing protein/PA domain-containing protein/Inhibitor_I9 domain-containing protein, partial [Cephalotus follicularis]